jgi:REP element-mobilizing transposase RayT
MIAINAVSDHIHILIGLRPKQALSELVKYVKQSSSKWINSKGLTPIKFKWQQGFGAFSHSKPEIKSIIQYIKNQESHHQKKSFREEYTSLLKRFEIDFDDKFIFKPPL